MSKKAINVAVNALVKRLEKTEKFAMEQAPEICKQMVEAEMIEIKSNIVGCGLTFLLLSVLAGIALHSANTYIPSDRFDDGRGMRYLIFGMLSFFAMFPASAVWQNVVSFIYVKKCPKLFLLKEFRKLV